MNIVHRLQFVATAAGLLPQHWYSGSGKPNTVLRIDGASDNGYRAGDNSGGRVSSLSRE